MFDCYDDTPESDPGYEHGRGDWRTQVHKTAEYQALRRQFREQCRQHRNPDGSYGLPCWRCHNPIDYRLRWPHPGSFSLDHAALVSQHPERALSPDNFQPAHLRCNQTRQGATDDDADELDIGEPSEIW